ncbi:MAG: hypothetical protein AAB569_02400 [Patescibacteria group bacterium]
MSRSLRIFKDKLFSFVENLVLIVITLAVALLPVWIFLLIKYFLSPEGFWQNVLLLGVSLWFLGFIQLVLLIFWTFFILKFYLGD